MFDATEWKKAFEPPTFTDLDGKVYVGRLMGADTWFRLQPDLRIANTDGSPNHAAIEKATYRIVSRMFPTPWWAPWRNVARKVWRLPPIMRMRAVMDFTHSQDQWIRGRLSPRPGNAPVSSPNSGEPEGLSLASTTAGA